MMLSGTRGPYGTGPARFDRLRAIAVAVGIVILALFIVDKLVRSPPVPEHETSVAAVIDHLNRHDVRRITIPTQAVTVELNDGTTLTTVVPAERDLWPAIRRSGADVTIVRAPAPKSDTSPMSYLLSFVPLVIMALVLLYLLRGVMRDRLR